MFNSGNRINPVLKFCVLNFVPFAIFATIHNSIIPIDSIPAYQILSFFSVILSIIIILVLVSYSVFKLIKKRHSEQLHQWVNVFTVCLFSAVIFIGVLISLGGDSSFENTLRKNIGEYEAAVAQVSRMQINDEETVSILLPLRYRTLSYGGYVMCRKNGTDLNILFKLGADIMDDDIYGLVYRSDGALGDSKDNMFSGDITSYNKWLIKRP